MSEYATQIIDTYQAKINVRQNKGDADLTIVTTIFMPLTLITGWYGMNFNIPENNVEIRLFDCNYRTNHNNCSWNYFVQRKVDVKTAKFLLRSLLYLIMHDLMILVPWTDFTPSSFSDLLAMQKRDAAFPAKFQCDDPHMKSVLFRVGDGFFW